MRVLIGFLACIVCGGAQEVLVDKIVAVCGDHPVLHSEAEEKTASGQLVVLSDFPAERTASRMERAINDLVNLQLVREVLAERDAEVKRDEVERRISSFLQGKSLTRTDLMDFLRTQGKTYREYFQDFANQLLVQKFQSMVILPMVNVTDADVRTYYMKKSLNFGKLLELDIRQVFSPKPEVMETAYRALQRGMTFKEAVALYHDNAALSEMRGVLLRDLTGEIQQAVRDLKAGEYTAPLKTATGYHIFLVEGRRIKDDSDFQAQKTKLEQELRNMELLKQTNLWLEKARARTNIQILHP